MKQLKNTLYLSYDEGQISCSGRALVIRAKDQALQQFPVHILEQIVCFGSVMLTPDAMNLCLANNVTINYLSVYGRFRGRISGPVRGNVLLRRMQFRRADDPVQTAELATAFLLSKISNARTVLLRHARERETNVFDEAVRDMAGLLVKLKGFTITDLNELRGLEGDAANIYFRCFDSMILKNRETFSFHGRSRRPPSDPINALLSLGYSLLAAEITGVLESVGLDPSVGFLHKDRPGRPSLALDLMEEFRAVVVDRFVLALVNREQLQANDFETDEAGGVALTEKARKEIFLNEWENRKRTEIIHPVLGEKISFGLLPHVQAMLLARSLRGDLDFYPPFFLK